ncbi:hypothetical protein D3C84_1177850 [compost metagenome]
MLQIHQLAANDCDQQPTSSSGATFIGQTTSTPGRTLQLLAQSRTLYPFAQSRELQPQAQHRVLLVAAVRRLRQLNHRTRVVQAQGDTP